METKISQEELFELFRICVARPRSLNMSKKEEVRVKAMEMGLSKKDAAQVSDYIMDMKKAVENLLWSYSENYGK